MDGKGFFLGLIAAVVLFMLWKRENGGGINFSFAGLMPAAPGASGSGGCAGCASGVGGCAGCSAASPAAQASGDYNPGQISPGTPPLQTAIGSGSFYAQSGPTPDSSFTNYPAKPTSTSITSAGAPRSGSATVPANKVPVRATAQVPSYSNQGFVSRYNVAGVPRTILRKTGYIQ